MVGLVLMAWLGVWRLGLCSTLEESLKVWSMACIYGGSLGLERSCDDVAKTI